MFLLVQTRYTHATQNQSLLLNGTNFSLVNPAEDIESYELLAIIYADYAIRVITLVCYICYFIFICFKSSFRTRQLIFLHNFNFIGLLYSIQYSAYIYSSRPSFENETLNGALCYFSSILWAILKYIRSYSALLLGKALFLYLNEIKFNNKVLKTL